MRNTSIDSNQSATSWVTPNGHSNEIPEHIVEEEDIVASRPNTLKRLVRSVPVRDPRVKNLVKDAAREKRPMDRTFYRRVLDKKQLSPHHKLLYVMCQCRQQQEQNNEQFQRMVHHCNHNRESTLQ
jgi:hypothetical protein